LADQDYKPEHPMILALDTSSRLTSIALSRGPQVFGSIKIESGDKRSEKLWVDIEALLAESGITIKDIGLFGVCVGPGGFTGLRVGMAAMKGFAAATGKHIVGVTSLEAAAMQAEPGRVACALVNAYKSEVYSQLFSIDEEGVPVALGGAVVSTLGAALERIGGRSSIVFTGDAALESAELIARVSATKDRQEVSREEAGAGWVVKNSDQLTASNIARLSYLRFARGESETGESLRACYVRPAEAELKLSLGLLGSKIKRSLKSD
jgi:tRNA threonylcarbamoyladenosine biosynthesis protein TsaB